MTIHCDAGQNKKTNGTSYASVTDDTGNDIVGEHLELFPDIKVIKVTLPVGERYVGVVECDQQNKMKNNTGELMALTMALRIVINSEEACATILCDSKLLVEYWSKNHVNAKTRSKMSPRKLEFIVECAKLRKILEENGGSVKWISGDDNMADLGCGRHPNKR